MFLRELPTPLVPRGWVYPHLVAAMQIEDEGLRVRYFSALVASMPRYNRALLQ
jgi:hypothetical protein